MNQILSLLYIVERQKRPRDSRLSSELTKRKTINQKQNQKTQKQRDFLSTSM
jgi:hypothetical protein